MMLGLVSGLALLSSAWAQQQPSGEEAEDAASGRPEHEASGNELGNDMNDGGESTGKRPRLLPPRLRPKELTPEELEEAERLRRLGAKYGTDPTAIIGRIQLSSQYFDLRQGAQATASTARMDVPFRGNYLVRIDMPFLRTLDPNTPGAGNRKGAGDLAVTAGWRAYNTPEYAVLAGAIGTFPTADDTALGLGKYTVGPALATARFIPRWDSFLIGLLQYQTSVGGDPARKDFSFFSFTAQVNSFWAERWWSVAQALFQVDFERSGKSSMALELEVGRNLVRTLGVYVRPGVGVWGQSLAGTYQWNVEAGVRYMFRSF
ncbi:MAG TPA: hypothetical protein VJ746_18475 [Nitrospira sp.]|nr:hypothetical protein [Nitrospira sp.]